MPWMRNNFLRKAYATTVGTMLGFYCYGFSYMWYVLFIVHPYILLRILPRSISPRIIIALSFTFMLLQQTYHWCVDAGTDPSVKTAIMMGFVQIYYIATNYADADPNIDPKKKALLSKRELFYAEYLEELPSLTEWL